LSAIHKRYHARAPRWATPQRAQELRRLVALFGRDRMVEFIEHGSQPSWWGKDLRRGMVER
jgi:hypothetical protein